MNDDLLALAKVRLEDILSFFEINADVKVSEEDEQIKLSVDTDGGGRLIGRHGETLAALQHLLNALVRRQTTERVFVNLDVAGYKAAQAEKLAAKAKSLAEKAISTGQPQTMRPMTPAERRLVHMALADFSEIETESTGEDPYRRVVIKKK